MWSTLDVGGKPVDFHEPPGTAPRSVLIFLHDVHEVTLRESPLGHLLLGEADLACVCPRGGQSWWSSGICPEFDPIRSAEQWLLDDMLAFVVNRWGIAPNAMALAGVGMGGQGALRLAFKHPRTFPIVAAIDAAIDHHELYGAGAPLDGMYPSREHCRQDTAILHIQPANPPRHIWFSVSPRSRWWRGNDRLHEKLAALGITHTFKSPAASAGEEMSQFMREALTLEARRLL